MHAYLYVHLQKIPCSSVKLLPFFNLTLGCRRTWTQDSLQPTSTFLPVSQLSLAPLSHCCLVYFIDSRSNSDFARLFLLSLFWGKTLVLHAIVNFSAFHVFSLKYFSFYVYKSRISCLMHMPSFPSYLSYDFTLFLRVYLIILSYEVYDGRGTLEEGETAEARFIKIQAAYELLMDNEKRRSYDRDNRVNPMKVHLNMIYLIIWSYYHNGVRSLCMPTSMMVTFKVFLSHYRSCYQKKFSQRIFFHLIWCCFALVVVSPAWTWIRLG